MAFLFAFLGFSQETKNTIKGTITDGNSPLQGVSIIIKGTEIGTLSDEKGTYLIQARPLDILVFSFVGMKTEEIIVQDVTARLNIEMQPDVEELDEVVVTKKKNRYSQKDLAISYAVDSTIVNTSLGYLNPDTAFFEFYTLSGDDLKGSPDVFEALRRKLHGIRVRTVEFGAKAIFLSSRTGTRAIFEVDGSLLKQLPPGIRIEDITRVGVMYGNQAEQRFGKIAIGGVIFINTKNGLHGAREGNTKRPYDRAKLRNNKYQDDAITKETNQNGYPKYLKEFYNSKNSEAAVTLHEKYKTSYKNSPYYFIDVYQYFMTNGNPKLAETIRSEAIKTIEDNPVLLKAWAYHMESNKEVKEANDLYEKIFILRPKYSQSYLDIASSYRDIGEYKKSASLFARYNYLVDKGFLKSDSLGISSIMEREVENLLALEGDKVMEGAKTTNRSSKYTEFDGTRLLFEWNDSEAEFELQFVNPQKHYYTWEHTMEVNPSRIRDEKEKGYSCEEFLVDSSLPGKWQININYKGNKKLEPSYLKVTTYYNYGDTSQKKEVKVYRLALRNVNQQLFDLNNPGIISAD